MAEYAHPEVMVSTDWVARNLKNPSVRVVEVDVDTKAYDEGHIPGAVCWAWNTLLCDTVRQDIIPKAEFENLMGSSGISNETTVVLYSDNNNWFVAKAFWPLKSYGHRDVRIMSGGRKKWIAEGKELAKEVPHVIAAQYDAKDDLDLSVQAFGARGKVKSFNATKGYGFIVTRDERTKEEREIFVHRSAIPGEGFRALEEGQEVQFEISEEGASQAGFVFP